MKPNRQLVLLGGLLASCASDLARVSSPAIGCAPQEIQIENVSVGWAETSWLARCRGEAFHCAGEDLASCSPDRASQSMRSTTSEQ